MISRSLTRGAVVAALSLSLLAGCKSKEEKAIDQARLRAAQTGQPQQVIAVDKNGNTTTTTVQPPMPGQKGQQITTTVTPASQPPAQAQNGAAAGVQNEAQTQAQAIRTGEAPASGPAPQDAGAAPAPAPAAIPQPGGAPVIRPADVHVPAGTTVTIRINQRISVKHSYAGEHFTGEVADPIAGDNNQVVIPRGTPVGGVIVEAHRRGHFKGRSILQLRLTSLELNGTRYPITTRSFTETKKGKGRRTAGLIGGGAGLGMLVGGVASGGVGLLVGGLAGGGGGTALAGLTGNRDIEIPAESIVRFRLADDLTLQQ